MCISAHFRNYLHICRSPLGRPFGDFVAAARVAVLGVVPSVVRAWRASDCMAGLNWNSTGLRCFSSTGEASSAEDYFWLCATLGGYCCPVIEYCGGTELAGGFITGTILILLANFLVGIRYV